MIASSPIPLSSSPAHSTWDEIQTLYRRVCVLRAQNRVAEADRLAAGALAHAVDNLRATSRPEDEAELRALFVREENRVADAATLAEILLPLLRDALSASMPVVGAPAGRPAGAPASSPRPAVVAEAGIADFIDEMISFERDPGRSSADLGSRP